MVSWQSTVVIECYAISDIVQAMILVADPTYDATRWRGTLFAMAAAVFVSTFNIVLAGYLSCCEGVFATVHFFAYVPVLVGLFVLSPKRSAADVFLHFTQTDGKWPDASMALFVGQVSNLFVMLGSDGVAHLAEEIEDAGVVLPRSMLWSYYINAPLTLLMATVYCFSIRSIPEALASPMPFVVVFGDTFQGHNATIAFTTVVLFLTIVVAISSLAATSRQIFAFALVWSCLLSNGCQRIYVDQRRMPKIQESCDLQLQLLKQLPNR
jgi:amino acid transporter